MPIDNQEALSGTDEDLEDGFEDYPAIDTLDMPPRFLEWGTHDPFFQGDGPRMLISYGIATTDQKKAIFPKRRPPNEVLSFKSFADGLCYELWIEGNLVGLCEVSVNGSTAGDAVLLMAKLEAIYLKTRFRKKGLVTPFLEVVGHSICQELITYIMREAQAGRSTFEVTVEADLYSAGGQASIVILGEQIENSLGYASAATDLSIAVDVVSDAW